MSAVFLAAAIALPEEGEPDLDAMRAFIDAHQGPWPMSEGENTHPARLFAERAGTGAPPAPGGPTDALWRAVWVAILDDFAGILRAPDEVACLRLRGCYYLILGDWSWGDFPEGYDTVSSISEWADLCAAGGMLYTWAEEPLEPGLGLSVPAGSVADASHTGV